MSNPFADGNHTVQSGLGPSAMRDTQSPWLGKKQQFYPVLSLGYRTYAHCMTCSFDSFAGSESSPAVLHGSTLLRRKLIKLDHHEFASGRLQDLLRLRSRAPRAFGNPTPSSGAVTFCDHGNPEGLCHDIHVIWSAEF